MSRIGKQIISVPSNVKIVLEGQKVKVSSSKGELEQTIPDLLELIYDKNTIILKKKNNSLKAQQLYGTSRSLINSLVLGISEGFHKKLEISGVGYRAQMNGMDLVLNMGYSHPIIISPPKGINIAVEKNISITVSGFEKQLVGQIAANIREVRPPEPYKGKGIRYHNEIVKRKVGKAGRGK